MRKILLIILLLGALLPIDVRPVSAICGCRCFPGICPGDLVIDVNALSIQINILAEMVEKYGKEVSININDSVTSANTSLLKYNEIVTKPLQSALNLNILGNSSKQILSLVNGSSGGNALLVANPEKFIQEKGLGSLQASYNSVENQNASYSESILDRLVDLTRKENGDDELLALTRSDVPDTIQENACTDENLSEMAEEDVTEGFSVEADTGAYDARRAELYNALCTCDPREDRECENRLLALNQQRPSVGGWDSFLRRTGGDNTYTKSTEAANLVAKKAAETEAVAKDDLDNGKGIQSSKTCTKKDSKGLCIEEAVVAPGSFYSKAYTEAKLSPLRTNIASIGTGINAGSLFSDLSGILNLTTQSSNPFGNIATIFNSINGDLGGNGGLDPKVATARTPTPNTSTVTNSSFVPDLAGDTSKRNKSIMPFMAILNTHLKSLDNLSSVDTDYISQINRYKNLVNGVKRCFESAQTYAINHNYSYIMPVDVLNFYNHENQVSDNLITTLTVERDASLPNTLKIVTDLKTKLEKSVSSEEITSLTNQYRDFIDSRTILDQIVTQTRMGDLASYKSNLQVAELPVGSIGKQMEDCAKIRENTNTAQAAAAAALAAFDSYTRAKIISDNAEAEALLKEYSAKIAQDRAAVAAADAASAGAVEAAAQTAMNDALAFLRISNTPAANQDLALKTAELNRASNAARAAESNAASTKAAADIAVKAAQDARAEATREKQLLAAAQAETIRAAQNDLLRAFILASNADDYARQTADTAKTAEENATQAEADAREALRIETAALAAKATAVANANRLGTVAAAQIATQRSIEATRASSLARVAEAFATSRRNTANDAKATADAAAKAAEEEKKLLDEARAAGAAENAAAEADIKNLESIISKNADDYERQTALAAKVAAERSVNSDADAQLANATKDAAVLAATVAIESARTAGTIASAQEATRKSVEATRATILAQIANDYAAVRRKVAGDTAKVADTAATRAAEQRASLIASQDSLINLAASLENGTYYSMSPRPTIPEFDQTDVTNAENDVTQKNQTSQTVSQLATDAQTAANTAATNARGTFSNPIEATRASALATVAQNYANTTASFASFASQAASKAASYLNALNSVKSFVDNLRAQQEAAQNAG